MESGGRSTDLRTATVEAFYARVMQRVCAAYCKESELPADEAVKLLEQKWKQKLALYTGSHEQLSATTHLNEASEVEVVASSSDSGSEASDGFSSSSSSSAGSEAASEQAVGRPSAQLPSVATSTSSIFARMLGGKRKLHQLDGTVSDEDDVEWRDAADQEQLNLHSQSTETVEDSPTQEDSDDEEGALADAEDSFDDDVENEEAEVRSYRSHVEEEKEVQEDDEELPSSPVGSTASTSFLIAANDLAPVSGLSGINLPLQLAAEYSKFNHRGKRRGYLGQLQSIVLTWPSRLGSGESIRRGDLVWCCPNSEQGFVNAGELVKVLSLGDVLHDLRVELTNGTETTVRMDRVRRLKEYLIHKGSVRFRSEQ